MSYKILLFPIVQGSHILCNVAIARELGRRQHETHILIDDGYQVAEDMAVEAKKFNFTFVRPVRNIANTDGVTAAEIAKIAQRMVASEYPFKDYMKDSAHFLDYHAKLLFLDNEPFIEKLKSTHYDLAVIDGFFFTKHFYLLPHRLGIPWVTYTDYPHPWAMRVPWLPSIVPGKF